MSEKIVKVLFTLLMMVITVSCGYNRSEKQKAKSAENYKSTTISANRSFIAQEAELIDAYVEKSGLAFQKSGTGLRYLINTSGESAFAVENNIIEISYDVRLLDGTYCYSSDSLGNMKFKLGYADVPSGLNEALFMMREGDKAKLILPTHLAYGLTGDQNMIPGSSAIVYNVHLIKIQ